MKDNREYLDMVEKINREVKEEFKSIFEFAPKTLLKEKKIYRKLRPEVSK